MLSLLTRITCLSGLILGAGLTSAEDDHKPPDRYQVELIVFRHTDQSLNTPEIPAATSIFQVSPLNLMLAEIPLQPPQMPSAPLGMLDNTRNKRFRRAPISFHLLELDPVYPYFVPLRDDTRTLSQVYERLERVDAYQPITYKGWVQHAPDSENAKPWRFAPAIVDDPGITGTVTLYKGRYLHLDVNLTLKTENPSTGQQFLFRPSGNKTQVTYKLSETRRIRVSETHYFDSPQFGIITRINALQTAVAERQETS